MTVNGISPGVDGGVVVGIPDIDELKGKIVRLDDVDGALAV